MPAKKSQERKDLGERVRAVRTRAGMSRNEFASALGVSAKTLQQVELGYQNLGRQGMRRVEAIADGRGLEVAEESGHYHVKYESPWLEVVVNLMLDEKNRAQVLQLATLLNISIQRAWIVKIREHMANQPYPRPTPNLYEQARG